MQQSGSNGILSSSENSNHVNSEDYNDLSTQDYSSQNNDFCNQPTQDYSSDQQQEKENITLDSNQGYTNGDINTLHLNNLQNNDNRYQKHNTDDSRSEGEVTPSSTKEEYLTFSSGMDASAFVDY